MSVKSSAGLLFVLTFALSVAFAQEPPRVLGSFTHITVQTSDGRSVQGNGFLLSRDGVMATALHLLQNAKRVTARFSDGEEYECSGIIDSDVARNVALVRIKQFGRPLMKTDAREIGPGAQLYAPVFKDGAFGTIGVVTGETIVYDNRPHIALSGEVPLGNSGGPVVDQDGVAVGYVIMRMVDDKPASFVISIAPLLALDSTLPTKPFGEAVGQSPQPGTPAPTSAVGTSEDIDTLFGKAIVSISDNMSVMDWADVLKTGFGFRNGVPRAVYDFQQEMDGIAGKLTQAEPSDPLRQKLKRSILEALSLQKGSSENFIRAVVVAQQIGAWGAQSLDAHNRAASARTALVQRLLEIGPDIAELEKASPVLKDFLFPDLRYLLNISERRSGIRLGVINYARRPFFMLVVYTDGLGYKIGLRAGDTIKSAAGQDFTKSFDLEDFKLLIKQNPGKRLDAVVERDGKDQRITLKIPKKFPATAMLE